MFRSKVRQLLHFRARSTQLRRCIPSENQEIEITDETLSISENRLLVEFQFIFRLFYVCGIEFEVFLGNKIRDGTEIPRYKFDWKKLIHSIWKYFLHAVMGVRFLLQTLWVILLPDKRIGIARLVLSFSFTLLYASIHSNRAEMISIIKGLSQAYKRLPNSKYRTRNHSLVMYFIILINTAIFCFFTLSLRRYDEIRFHETVVCKSDFVANSLNLAYYRCLLLFGIFDALFYVTTATVIILYVSYYGLTCLFIRKVLRYFLEEIHGKRVTETTNKLLRIYQRILETVIKLEESFSLPIFITVLLAMFTLFWIGYKLAFAPNLSLEYSLGLVYKGVFSLFLLLVVMVSAALTNEAIQKTKASAQCLSYCVSGDYGDTKFVLKKYLYLGSKLTLWKFYVLNRLFMLYCFDCLINYGILFATLGKKT